MKRIFASLMVVFMLVTCSQTYFAAPPDGEDYFGMAQMELAISARKTGTDEYVSSLNLGEISATTKVDYKIDLNMDSVKTVLGRAGSMSEADSVRDGKLVMKLDVTVDYPEYAVIDKASLSNYEISKVHNGIFVETKRNIDTELNKITSTFELNTPDLTLQNIIDGMDRYLANISYELKDSVAYATGGSHTATVSALGYVEIEFTYGHTEWVKLETAESVSNTVTATSPTVCVLLVEDAVAPTCTEDGHGIGVKCTYHTEDPYHEGSDPNYVDGTKRPATINAVGSHDLAEVEEVPATCTTSGTEKHYNCTRCKEKFTFPGQEPTTLDELKIVENPSHTAEPMSKEPATCTTDGHEAGTRCSVCGTVLSGMQIIPAGHIKDTTNGYTPAKAATCDEDGHTEGAKCKNCPVVLSVSMKISALGHKFSDWVVDGEQMTRTCSVCRETETKNVHTCAPYGEPIVVEPTCSTRGSSTVKCECGAIISVTPIERIGHTIGGLISGRDATCSLEGEIAHYECSECNLKFRDAEGKSVVTSIIIPKDKTNHSGFVDVPVEIYPATCLKPGLKLLEKCDDCGYVKNEIIPQYIHKAADKDAGEHMLTLVEKDARCEETGIVAHLHCSTTGKDFSIENNENGVLDDWTGKNFVIPAKGHSWVVDTTTSPATMRCSVCSDTKELSPVECPAHQYRRTILEEATCDADGRAEDVCLICGHKNSNVTLEAGHEYGAWIPAVPSTCNVKGTKGHYHCIKCNKFFDSNEDVIEEINYDLAEHDIDEATGECKKDCGYKVKVVVSENVTEVLNVENAINAKPNDVENKLQERENDFRNAVGDIGVTINYVVESRHEVSEEMDTDIQTIIENTNIDSIDGVGKIPFDIIVEKVIEYTDEADAHKKDITEIKETEDFIIIEIDISSIANMAKYVVHRVHYDEDGVMHREYIEYGVDNEYGERITSIEDNKLKFKAKRFSEYAVVGYSEDVGTLNPPVEDDTPSSSGGGSSTLTVRFHANGGTVVESVKVERGKTISEPVTSRDGYKLEGWYTDSALKNKFDFSTPIKSSLNLYAKWVEDGSDAICEKFTDVNIDEWYHEGIHYAIQNGMMNGTGAETFEPNTNVSRAMLVTVLWRAENEPIAAGASKFVDLEAGQYYVDAVKWANENGVVKGITETTFEPETAITREQFAAIMFRYANLKGYDVSIGEDTNILSYTDFDRISEYAIPAMQYAVGSGLIKGKSATTLNPADNATRAEMATILYRFIEANTAVDEVVE